MSSPPTDGSYARTEEQKQARNNLMGLMGTVEDVKTTMQTNIEKMNDRGDKLLQLEKSSEAMTHNAQAFANKAGKAPK